MDCEKIKLLFSDNSKVIILVLNDNLSLLLVFSTKKWQKSDKIFIISENLTTFFEIPFVLGECDVDPLDDRFIFNISFAWKDLGLNAIH